MNSFGLLRVICLYCPIPLATEAGIQRMAPYLGPNHPLVTKQEILQVEITIL